MKNIQRLRSVRQIDDNKVASGGKPLSYHKYLELLDSAAVQYDATLARPQTRGSRRVVNSHDVFGYDDYNDMGYVDGGTPISPTMTAQPTVFIN